MAIGHENARVWYRVPICHEKLPKKKIGGGGGTRKIYGGTFHIAMSHGQRILEIGKQATKKRVEIMFGTVTYTLGEPSNFRSVLNVFRGKSGSGYFSYQ